MLHSSCILFYIIPVVKLAIYLIFYLNCVIELRFSVAEITSILSKRADKRSKKSWLKNFFHQTLRFRRPFPLLCYPFQLSIYWSFTHWHRATAQTISRQFSRENTHTHFIRKHTLTHYMYVEMGLARGRACTHTCVRMFILVCVCVYVRAPSGARRVNDLANRRL